MKDPKITLAALLTSSALICATLVGCSGTSARKEADTSANSPNEQAYGEVYRVQIDYYEGLIRELEDKLLQEKESNYISITEYQSQISELQDMIFSLTEGSSGSQESAKPSNPTATTPTQDSVTEHESDHIYNNEENRPSTESLSSKNAFKYRIENGYATIVAYLGSDETVSIPSAIDGIKITAIGEEAFKNSSAERIIIPDTVEHIDWFAFYSCKSLCEITIPSSVTSISHGAFDLCPESLIIKCKKNSYAEAYAHSWGFIAISE